VLLFYFLVSSNTIAVAVGTFEVGVMLHHILQYLEVLFANSVFSGTFDCIS
jgi:hypothetical protein